MYTDVEKVRHRSVSSVTAGLTATMAFSMLQLFLLGALGPRIVVDLTLSPAQLGVAVAVGFGTAAVLSPVAGRLVDDLGPRRCLMALQLLVAIVLIGFALAPSYAVLIVAIGVGGIPQALANPATNKAILAAVEPSKRATVTGTKQSGVQLGAIAAGLPLSALAAASSWRVAVAVSAVLAVAVALWVRTLLPTDSAAPAPSVAVNAPASNVVAWLAGYSVLLGAAMSSVNTYLALFGEQRLDFDATTAGILVAVLGVAGIVGRIGWSRAAGRPRTAIVLPAILAAGAAVGAALLAITPMAHSGVVWIGVIAVGSFGMAGNAVSMVLVIQRAVPGRAGRDSAVVAAGFFTGFVLGPPAFGLLLPRSNYSWCWSLVVAEFLVAAGIAATWSLRRARASAA